MGSTSITTTKTNTTTNNPSISKKPSSNKKRYILFIGNLSFTTTALSLKSLINCESATVRLMTKKGTNESRGAAFVEVDSFEDFSRILGMSGQVIDGRGIRVEPTAGGGGTGEKRKEKLKVKKEKFEENAKKRSEKKKSKASDQ